MNKSKDISINDKDRYNLKWINEIDEHYFADDFPYILKLFFLLYMYIL